MKKEVPKSVRIKQQKHYKDMLKKTEKDRDNVRNWIEFSTKPRTEEEIREALKHDIGLQNNYKQFVEGQIVCMSYICRYSKLSPEFIEEISEIYRSSSINNKLDWDYISMYQKLTEEFILKHKNDVNWKLILKFQDLSNEFIVNNYITINKYILIDQRKREEGKCLRYKIPEY